MHKVIGFAMALGVTAVSAAATAQQGRIDNIGNGGGIVIGAERLAGGYHTTSTAESNVTQTVSGTPVTVEAEVESSQTNFAILGHADPGSPTQVPRLALDYFPVTGFSVGGSFMYLRESGEVEGEQRVSAGGATQTQTIDQKLPKVSAIIVNPRIGYAIAFNEYAGLWLRAGFSYAQVEEVEEITVTDPATGAEQDFEETDTTTYTNLTLEGLLFISPFSNFAFVGGPVADIGLGGKFESESDQPGSLDVDGDTKVSSYGFMIGIAGYFDTQ